jgi:glycyl-tRNA synthetase (class II)
MILLHCILYIQSTS